ncbi:non-structural maintenance of chromosomes element 3 homolog [Actinia tenebrosa]|uniref:Non-structural maintenance of chromosomes element 3 homolog n=1 Tax=Actinia tenebrosa TaxID=6105 RepID=A0A6P8I9G4_ACTTE|nr:non-structural maintenance of chromosomes element 3 homolog [Actinia tenebrosa]
MPRAKKQGKRKSLDSDEEEEEATQSQTQSQRKGKGKGPGKRRTHDDDDASQAFQSQKEKLSGAELDRKVAETVRYLLFCDKKKIPIKRADISKNVLREHARSFPQVIEQVKKQLQKVFGISLEEIEGTGKTKSYILIESIDCEEKHGMIDWGSDSPKMSLLMVILSLIFMSENMITEAHLWHTLKKLGLEQKVEHPVFGDPEKMISQEFLRQGYIEKKKIVGGDETSYEYRWGQRAFKETSKRQVLEFMSEIYGTESSVWTSQIKEIEQEEQENMEE